MPNSKLTSGPTIVLGALAVTALTAVTLPPSCLQGTRAPTLTPALPKLPPEHGILALQALQSYHELPSPAGEEVDTLVCRIRGEQIALASAARDLLSGIAHMKSGEAQISARMVDWRRISAKQVVASISTLEKLIGGKSDADDLKIPSDDSTGSWNAFTQRLEPLICQCLPYGSPHLKNSAPDWEAVRIKFPDWIMRAEQYGDAGKPLDLIALFSSGYFDIPKAYSLLNSSDAAKLRAVRDAREEFERDRHVLEQWERGTLSISDSWSLLSYRSRLEITKIVLGNSLPDAPKESEPSKFARAVGEPDSALAPLFAQLLSQNAADAQFAKESLLFRNVPALSIRE